MERSAAYARLLCEVAPDLALRGILTDLPSLPSAGVFRALLSSLLRASTPLAADSVHVALEKCLPLRAPLAHKLGMPAAAGKLRPVLADLAGALVRGAALEADGAALTFYDSAGPGSADPEELDDPPEDGLSTVFGPSIPTLAETRARSLGLVVRYFADAISSCKAGEGAKETRRLVRDDQSLRVLLTEDLSMSVGRLPPDTCSAAHSLLSAIASAVSEAERGEWRNAVVLALQDVAAKSPTSMISYVSSMADNSFKFRALYGYLRHRFGCGEDGNVEAKTLHVRAFVEQFLDVDVRRRKGKGVLPAALAGFVQVWTALAEPECFEFAGRRRKVEAEKLRKHIQQRGDELLKACKPTERDAQDLRLVLVAVSAQVALANRLEMVERTKVAS